MSTLRQVVLFENEVNIRRFIAKALEAAPLELTVAESPLEVAHLLCSRSFDAAILDNQYLPNTRLTTRVVAQGIKQSSALSSLPVVLISARSEDQSTHDIFPLGETGVDAIIWKPFSAAEFSRLVLGVMDNVEQERARQEEQSRLVEASSPMTSTERLHALWREKAPRVSYYPMFESVDPYRIRLAERLARNANTPADLCEKVANYGTSRHSLVPDMLPLNLLADPGLLERVASQRGILWASDPDTPVWLLELLTTLKEPLIADDARQHISLGSELTADWRQEVRELAVHRPYLRDAVENPDISRIVHMDWLSRLVRCLRPGPTEEEQKEMAILQALPDDLRVSLEPHLWPSRVRLAAEDTNRLIRAAARGILWGETMSW